jgi:hypothetical protein
MKLRSAVLVSTTALMFVPAVSESRGGGKQRMAPPHNDRVFYFSGTAAHDVDPENPRNAVVRLTSAFDPANPGAAQAGAVARVFGERTRVWRLDNQLEAKAWFREPHTCGLGSPRISLAIDREGDGDSDGNAFGYLGTSPAFSLCPIRTWLFEDLKGGDGITGLGPSPSLNTLGGAEPGGPPNEELEWDLTQFGGPFYNTWSQVEELFAAFPQHRVCAAQYVDDNGLPAGTSYADVIVLGDAVWDGPEDTLGRGNPFARDACRFNPERPDDGEDDDHDDDDGDGDDDDGDDDDDDE